MRQVDIPLNVAFEQYERSLKPNPNLARDYMDIEVNKAIKNPFSDLPKENTNNTNYGKTIKLNPTIGGQNLNNTQITTPNLSATLPKVSVVKNLLDLSRIKPEDIPSDVTERVQQARKMLDTFYSFVDKMIPENREAFEKQAILNILSGKSYLSTGLMLANTSPQIAAQLAQTGTKMLSYGRQTLMQVRDNWESYKLSVASEFFTKNAYAMAQAIGWLKTDNVERTQAKAMLLNAKVNERTSYNNTVLNYQRLKLNQAITNMRNRLVAHGATPEQADQNILLSQIRFLQGIGLMPSNSYAKGDYPFPYKMTPQEIDNIYRTSVSWLMSNGYDTSNPTSDDNMKLINQLKQGFKKLRQAGANRITEKDLSQVLKPKD